MMAGYAGNRNIEDSEEAANPCDVHRTIVLLGKTGNGKSTLANVLVGAHRQKPPVEIFKEGEFGGSETLHAQEHIVEVGGKMYRIVDTIGIGDTGLSEEKVLIRLARTCHYLRNGINQILFVSTGRVTKEERDAYDLLRRVLFNDDVGRFVTIVRTKSRFCENASKCDEDVRKIKRTGEHARAIFQSAAMVMHVNNPGAEDYADEWVEYRDRTRARLLARLETCGEVYSPPQLEIINRSIAEHVEKPERLEKEIELLRKQQDERKAEHANEIEELKKTLSDVQKTATADKEGFVKQLRSLETLKESYEEFSRTQEAKIQQLEEQLAHEEKGMAQKILEGIASNGPALAKGFLSLAKLLFGSQDQQFDDWDY